MLLREDPSPLLGGSLADPAQRYPQFFRAPFLEKYPYFLPCFVAGAITFVAACLAAAFLEEVNFAPSASNFTCSHCIRKTHPFKRKIHEHEHYERSINFVNVPKERRLTIKELLAIPVIRALTISGAALCFSGTAFDAVFVLHCFTDVDEGGLGFSVSHFNLLCRLPNSPSNLLCRQRRLATPCQSQAWYLYSFKSRSCRQSYASTTPPRSTTSACGCGRSATCSCPCCTFSLTRNISSGLQLLCSWASPA
jgi:hypothetical protein